MPGFIGNADHRPVVLIPIDIEDHVGEVFIDGRDLAGLGFAAMGSTHLLTGTLERTMASHKESLEKPFGVAFIELSNN